MKRIVFLCTAGIVASVFDSEVFGLFITLSLSVCLSLFGGAPFVVICTIFGILLDFWKFSLPFYAFIYLYISVGCVWIRGFLFKANFGANLIFWLVSIIFTHLVSYEFSFLGFVLNALSFLVFYRILKGVKIEKNSKI